MFSGRVDRSGGREGKKSLRKNKIAIKDMQKLQAGSSLATEGKPAPPRLCALTPASLFDCGCALANRKFENDQLKVIERAKRLNVQVMMAMTNDFEKQEELLKLTGEHKGNIYALVGIHPDTVKRMNEKLFAQRLAQLKTLALSAPVVGLFCGLDFSRDVGSHYAQEKLLNAQLELSAQLGIPSVISQTSAHEKLVEIVLQHAANLPAIALFNFSAASESEIGSWIAINDQLPVYFILTGLITEKNEKIIACRTRLPQLPADRILIASDSPFYTPQNIDDVWIRENRNEPSNLEALLQLLSQVRGVTMQALAAQLRTNTKQFFSLLEEGELTDAEETEEVLRQLQDAKELEEQVHKAESKAAVSAADEEEEAEAIQPNPAPNARNENSPQSRKPAAAQPLKGKAARRERRMQQMEEDPDSDDDCDDNSRKRGNRKGQREPQRMIVLKPRAKEKPAAAGSASTVIGTEAKKVGAEDGRKGDGAEKEEDMEADDANDAEEEDLEVSGYACRVCRSVLFGTEDISPHQHGGGVETCQALFLKTVPAALKSSEGKLLCSKCDAKIGRTAGTPLPCSCGALQTGASTSVTVKKKAIDLLSNQMGALEIADYNDDRGPKKKKAEKRKGPVKKSTSNFSSFRNKDTK